MADVPRSGKSLIELFNDPRAVTAMQRGVRQALRRHKLLGESIVVLRDGKIVHVPPEEIVVDPEEEP